MLERTAGCLESGSLRRLLPGSKKSLKSRRSLHSAFWNHGAADIELSPLWAALLRGPDPDSADQQFDIQQQKNTNGGGGALLEFLYPAGTINFLRQYSGWGVDRSDGRRGRVGLARFGHRLYTSSAKDTLSKGENGGAEIVDETSIISWRHVPIDATNVELLQKLFGLTRSNEYDEAWRQYLLLGETDRQRLRHGLIEYLNPSNSVVEAERITEVFESLSEGERDSKSYKSAIRSYLRLRNLSDAMTLYKTAVNRFESPVGSDEVLAYMVENSLWAHAFNTWKDVQKLRERFPATSINLFAVIAKLPKLSDRGFELADYVDRRLRAADSSETSSAELLTFASRIVRCVLFNETFEYARFRNLLSILQKWKRDSPEVYEDAIGFLLNVNQPKVAVWLYRYARQIPDMKLSRPTLHAMLSIFCTHQSIFGTQQVLDDMFRFFTVPTRSAYRMCMKMFASMGDADTVHALFEQFISRFKDGRMPTNPADLAPILNVHAKRGELGEVIRYFNEMEEKYGVKPDLLCWNILLHAYGRVNDVDGAFSCFENLLATNIKLDDYTFGTIMGICVSNGDLERTVEIYRLADSMSIEKSNAMVDCLVLAHTQDERFEEAEKICEEALNMDLKRSRTRMWNYLLVAHALRRDLVNVNRILRRMTDMNVDYDASTYSALMLALVMVKQPERAYDILRDVMREAGVRPTNFHYAIVMGGFIVTGQFDHVFYVHNRMDRRDIRKSASNKLMMMKAAYKEDERLSQKGSLQEQSNRAFQIFQEVVGSMDPLDIVMTPRKAAGRIPTDIAYPSMFYSYILFILAQRDEHQTVQQLYEQYINILPENRRETPPIQILSALMISKLRNKEYDAVQECWDLALSRAKSEGRPLKFPDSILQNLPTPRGCTTESKILTRHQLDLQIVLAFYMKSLAKQQKIDGIIAVVNDLLDQGFLLNNKNWNQYISYLARNLRFKHAFELCETRLMDGWTGWARIRWQLPERNALPIEVRNLKKDPKYLRPKYMTLLYLGRCYLELQGMSAESRASEMLLKTLEMDCPRTLRAIKTMQRIDDDTEREILKSDSWAEI